VRVVQVNACCCCISSSSLVVDSAKSRILSRQLVCSVTTASGCEDPLGTKMRRRERKTGIEAAGYCGLNTNSAVSLRPDGAVGRAGAGETDSVGRAFVTWNHQA
jgi:hypothetical protein